MAIHYKEGGVEASRDVALIMKRNQRIFSVQCWALQPRSRSRERPWVSFGWSPDCAVTEGCLETTLRSLLSYSGEHPTITYDC